MHPSLHIWVHATSESRATPRVQGVQLRPIENIPDVTFCLNQFKKKIRMYGQPYEPIKLQVYVVCVYLCTFGIEPLPMFDCGFTTVL